MGTSDEKMIPSPPTTGIDVAIKVEEEDSDDGQSLIRDISEHYCSVDDDGDNPVAINGEEEDKDDDDDQSLMRDISGHYFSVNDEDDDDDDGGDDKEDDEQAIDYSKSFKATENDGMMKETTSKIIDKDSLLIRKNKSHTKTKYVHIDDDNDDTITTQSNKSSSRSRNSDNDGDDIEQRIRTELDGSRKSCPGAYAITHPDFDTASATDALSTTSTTIPTSVNAALSLSTVSTLTMNLSEIETRQQQRRQQQQQEPKLIEAEVVVDPTLAFEVINYENKKKMIRRKRNNWHLAVVITLVIVCTVAAVLVRKAKAKAKANEQRNSPPRYEYDCIMNTTELARIQYQDFKDSKFTSTKDRYILCPHTTSDIANLQSQRFENATTNLEDGNFPIVFVMSNTIIQCGLDDENDAGSCVISGGRWQLSLIGSRDFEEQFIPYLFPDYTQDELDLFFSILASPNNFVDHALDNIIVRGLTFTGDVGGFNRNHGNSVTVNIPVNLTFDNCRWRDIRVHNPVLYLTTDILVHGSGPYPHHSAQITLRNCQFDSIEYNYALIDVHNNIIVIENTTFNDIEVGIITAYDMSEYCPGHYSSHGVPISMNEQQNYMNQSNNCDYMIGCRRSSRCHITQSCKSNVETSGTQWLLKGPKATVTIDEQSKECGFNDDMPTTTQD